jgi:hypothetical protein
MHEVVIHRLTCDMNLGGYSEVMALSLMEALGHMCLLKDKDEAKVKNKQAERFLDFLAMSIIHPSKDDKSSKAREKFAEKIKPNEEKNTAGSSAPKKLGWNFDELQQIAESQYKKGGE